jgi:hypothetical protein
VQIRFECGLDSRIYGNVTMLLDVYLYILQGAIGSLIWLFGSNRMLTIESSNLVMLMLSVSCI